MGFFVWSSYGTGMGGTIGCVKRAVAAIWARMHFRVVGGRLVAKCSSRLYKSPLPHLQRAFFSPPRFTARHTCMNMEAVKGFLAPLGLNTSSIQDTLVCYTPLLPLLESRSTAVFCRNWLSLVAQSRLPEGPRYPHGMDLWIVCTSF